MTDPVVHFEMPAKDKKRTAQFYSSVFNWQMNQLGKDMGSYLLAGTAKTDENQMVLQPGAINGGFYDYEDKEGFNMPHIVISVNNLEESMEKIEKAGGKVLGGAKGPGTIDDIPGVGRYVAFRDTEGNHVGMLQPSPMGK